MSEMSKGPATAGENVPSPTVGSAADESDLPRSQGLNEGLAEGAEDAGRGSDDADRDPASEAGSVTGSGLEGGDKSGSDPMPDMAGSQPN